MQNFSDKFAPRKYMDYDHNTRILSFSRRCLLYIEFTFPMLVWYIYSRFGYHQLTVVVIITFSYKTTEYFFTKYLRGDGILVFWQWNSMFVSQTCFGAPVVWMTMHCTKADDCCESFCVFLGNTTHNCHYVGQREENTLINPFCLDFCVRICTYYVQCGWHTAQQNYKISRWGKEIFFCWNIFTIFAKLSNC